LAKVVLPVGGGGVTAGSVVSRASGFFENEVVLIMTDTQYSGSAGNCPDTNFGGSSGAKDLCAGAGRCASGENVINQDNSLSIEGLAPADGEGAADIGKALWTAKEGLCLRGQNAAKKAIFYRNISGIAEVTSEAFGLIEFAFAQLGTMEGNGNNDIPFCLGQARDGAAEEQFGQERLETKSAVILVAMDNVEEPFTRDDRGAREGETQIDVAAIGAFEYRSNLPLVREAASLTERRIDESDLRSAGRADETFRRCGAAVATQLADFGINKG
jgi:hypothetical protein